LCWRLAGAVPLASLITQNGGRTGTAHASYLWHLDALVIADFAFLYRVIPDALTTEIIRMADAWPATQMALAREQKLNQTLAASCCLPPTELGRRLPRSRLPAASLETSLQEPA